MKRNAQLVEFVVPPQKRTRRKLMDFPVKTPSPAASKHFSLCHLEDSLSKEVQPIVYTPESCRKTIQSSCSQTVVKQALHLAGLQETNECNTGIQLRKPTSTDSMCDVVLECDEDRMDSTVILSEGTGETNGISIDLSAKKSQLCSNSILQRYFSVCLGKECYLLFFSVSISKRF